MLTLAPLPKIITFDCYGTLVQWHHAVQQAAAALLEKHQGATPPHSQALAFADRLRAITVERQQQPPFCTYDNVLCTGLEQALEEAGHRATAEDMDTLLAILGRIPPHPEVPDVLACLRERYQVAIISNTTDQLIAGTVSALGTPIDFVITAEQARAYKPDHQLFLHAHEVMGVTKEQTVHVAMGQFSDLKVCKELGIRCVWINRKDEPLNADWQPEAVLKDLSGLPALLTP